MKKFTFLLTLAALALAALPSPGQNIGLYTFPPFTGAGSVVQQAQTTNTFISYTFTNGVWNGVTTTNSYQTITGGPGSYTNALTQSVLAYDNVGLTYFYQAGFADTNAPIGIQIYRSYNYGVTFEPNPWQVWTNPAATAAAQFTYATNLAAQGVTTLGFNFINLATNGYSSNELFAANLKAPTAQYVQAGIYNGPTTPTPSATSTNWVP